MRNQRRYRIASMHIDRNQGAQHFAQQLIDVRPRDGRQFCQITDRFFLEQLHFLQTDVTRVFENGVHIGGPLLLGNGEHNLIGVILEPFGSVLGGIALVGEFHVTLQGGEHGFLHLAQPVFDRSASFEALEIDKYLHKQNSRLNLCDD